jgi:hypothetical protein
MSDTVTMVAMLLLYKLAVLVAGVVSIHMGYRLFLADKTAPAGDLSVSVKEYALSLKGGAPGIFFSLFGTILIGLSIAKGFNYERSVGPAPVVQVIPDEPPV